MSMFNHSLQLALGKARADKLREEAVRARRLKEADSKRHKVNPLPMLGLLLKEL